MLTQFGAKDVSILNGGFPKWLKEGRPINKGGTYLTTGAESKDWTDAKDIVKIKDIHKI